jgi:hypothetical protein
MVQFFFNYEENIKTMHASILTLPTLQSYGGILSHQTLIKASLSHCGGTITKETS